MEKTNDWMMNLTAAGYLPRMVEGGAISLAAESHGNAWFLRRILKRNRVAYETRKDHMIVFLDPAPSLEVWMGWLAAIPANPGEAGDPADNLQLVTIEPYVRALTRQLNRLGLKTTSACQGHQDDPNMGDIRSARGEFRFGDDVDPDAIARGLAAAGLGFVRNDCMYQLGTTKMGLVHAGLCLAQLAELPSAGAAAAPLAPIGSAPADRLLLERLLNLRGPFADESAVRAEVKPLLATVTDACWQDEFGNLLATKDLGAGPTVLLSAHLDTVDDSNMNGPLIREGRTLRRQGGILGADDRAGIAGILLLLGRLPYGRFVGQVRVVFTVQEEHGQHGAEAVDQAFLQTVDHAIMLDRRGTADIITHSSSRTYAHAGYGKVFERVSRQLFAEADQYHITQGGTSDLRVWAAAGIPSVNLSIGYQNEHTDQEELDLRAWERSLSLVLGALEELAKLHQGGWRARRM